MTTEEILKTLTDVMNETFEIDYDVQTSTSADDIDEWDSIAHIELISKIEAHYGVRFALGELQDLQNVGDFIKLVQEKLS
jgi:acyl carrier protein